MPDFTALDGTRLSYTDEGAGLPILALAGLTRNGSDFDHLAPSLFANGTVRLIRLDYRGRGASDWADPATYTIPQEAADVLSLLDHLELDKVAIIGTSRGGLIAMMLAATAKDRLLGVALNDIGPEIDAAGLSVIKDYIGRNPAQATYEEAAAFRAKAWSHFKGVPRARWLAEVKNHYTETPEGLIINYDPRLRDAVLEAGAQPVPDLWPLYDALTGLPLAMLRGDASDLLSSATFEEMRNRRPDAHADPNPMSEATDISMIRAAAQRLHGHARRTPLLSSPFLDEIAGRRVFIKPECLQHTGSFKFRGAWSALSALDPAVRANGVIAFSSGNHAQGVALAAARHDTSAVIIMPADAPQLKIDNTRALGAEVVLYDRDTEDRDEIGARLAVERNLTLVKPFDEPLVIAGQATCGLEIAEDANDLGLSDIDVLVCCGGGGLTSGIALACEADAPSLRIRPVEPEGFDDVARSLKAGTIKPPLATSVTRS